MWNSLVRIWRTLDTLFWIVTALILLYFLYTISDGRFRFLFWHSSPATNGNAVQQPDLVQPWDEAPRREDIGIR